MTETTWSEESIEPPKKKGIPLWVWGCGGGCLLMIIAVLVVTVMGVRMFEAAKDPEVVWPKIAEHLPFDERPEGRVVFGSNIRSMGFFVIADPETDLVGILITSDDEEDQEELDKLFAGEQIQGGFAGVGEIQESEPLKLTVKGRDVNAVRLRSSGMSLPGVDTSGNEVWVILIDLRREGESGFAMLELISQKGTEEMGQAEVEAFFEPFDPWR